MGRCKFCRLNGSGLVSDLVYSFGRPDSVDAQVIDLVEEFWWVVWFTVWWKRSSERFDYQAKKMKSGG